MLEQSFHPSVQHSSGLGGERAVEEDAPQTQPPTDKGTCGGNVQAALPEETSPITVYELCGARSGSGHLETKRQGFETICTTGIDV